MCGHTSPVVGQTCDGIALQTECFDLAGLTGQDQVLQLIKAVNKVVGQGQSHQCSELLNVLQGAQIVFAEVHCLHWIKGHCAVGRTWLLSLAVSVAVTNMC